MVRIQKYINYELIKFRKLGEEKEKHQRNKDKIR